MSGDGNFADLDGGRPVTFQTVVYRDGTIKFLYKKVIWSANRKIGTFLFSQYYKGVQASISILVEYWISVKFPRAGSLILHK